MIIKTKTIQRRRDYEKSRTTMQRYDQHFLYKDLQLVAVRSGF